MFLIAIFREPLWAYEPVSPLEQPDDLNKVKVQLGKQLFHDVRLSNKENISCASCHAMDKAGADGLALSPGTNGELTDRNTPTVFNSRFNIAQFWDGRADNLEEQIDAVINNPIEMGGDWPGVIKRLLSDQKFVDEMSVWYQPPVSKDSITDALAEYMKALVTAGAPFDDYLRGDPSAVSPDAKAGYELFKTLGCSSCHQGINVGGNLYQRAGVKIPIDGRIKKSTAFAEDLGRFNVTGRERDKFVFRVPSLRNVVDTAPYFHNGKVPDLDSAILLMARFQLGKDIRIEQVRLIKEFLYTLNADIPAELK